MGTVGTEIHFLGHYLIILIRLIEGSVSNKVYLIPQTTNTYIITESINGLFVLFLLYLQGRVEEM